MMVLYVLPLSVQPDTREADLLPLFAFQYFYGNKIENTLNDHGAKATFFVNGNNYECIYSPDNVAALKQRYAEGHLIGSHTWNHADIATLSADELNDELQYVEDALKKILGVKPRFFRKLNFSLSIDRVFWQSCSR